MFRKICRKFDCIYHLPIDLEHQKESRLVQNQSENGEHNRTSRLAATLEKITSRAVWEAAASSELNGIQIDNPPETPRTLQHLYIVSRGLRGPQFVPHDAERCQFLSDRYKNSSLRKILQQKRRVQANHWNPSKLKFQRVFWPG